MKERLQKIISAAGITSRRNAEKLISEGRVTVNGTAACLGESADPDRDEICIDGRRIAVTTVKTYIMLNKPRGYVTTLKDEKGRKTVAELVSGAGVRLFPVGRLDMDSEGLLLMTDDGELTNKLTHPSHLVKKIYEVLVSGNDINEALSVLRLPLIIDGYRIHPAQVEVHRQNDSGFVLHISIFEGRNRQIRQMCAQAGLKVHRLKRISEGELKLGNLPSGSWRYLSKSEIAYLQKII